MKNFILILFLTINLSAFCDEPFIVYPDVMNKVSIVENTEGVQVMKFYDADSLPVFPGFPKIVNGQSIEGGIYCQMDSDSELEIVYGIGMTVQAWNIDGSNLTGWPKSLSFNSQGAPSYGDIDGDGVAEIVIGSASLTGTTGSLYAFEKDGTPVTGFPVSIGAARTVALCDMDNNGSLEIITSKRLSSAGEIYIYKGDGTIFPGWPKAINHVPASSSAAGDITGDGLPEIISESYTSIYAWDRNGNVLPGFPFILPNGDVNSYSSPVLADVDGDNIREIIFGSHVSSAGGLIYILKNDGTVMPGWPKSTNYWIYGPPVLGYVNDDNVIDIIVGDQIGSGTPVNFVYGWDKNGNVLNGFPIGPVNAVNNQVALADIDNDMKLELLIDDNSQTGGIGKYPAFNHDGTPVLNWDLPVNGTSFFNMPCLTDLNSDGILDIVGAGYTLFGSNQTSVYIWNAGIPYDATKVINPVFQFNVRHNGVYGDNNLVSVLNNNNTIPENFKLEQNYPNPFNPSTVINYSLPTEFKGNVKLNIYNALGKEIAELVNESQGPGNYSVEWEATGFTSGIYFYVLESGFLRESKSMVLLK
ncbi:MAG: FG-GAP-like repeat-containing protein [Ignavibacteria bacterium]